MENGSRLLWLLIRASTAEGAKLATVDGEREPHKCGVVLLDSAPVDCCREQMLDGIERLYGTWAEQLEFLPAANTRHQFNS
jgi:hypothetical protein